MIVSAWIQAGHPENPPIADESTFIDIANEKGRTEYESYRQSRLGIDSDESLRLSLEKKANEIAVQEAMTPVPTDDRKLPVILKAYHNSDEDVGAINDLPMTHAAIKKGWNIPDSLKTKVIEKAEKLLESEDPNHITSGCRVIIAADLVNVKREGNDISERRGEVVESTALLREAMRTPEIRQQLARIANQIDEKK